MDASLAKFNTLVLSHADIQASPQDVVRLNSRPMTIFRDTTLESVHSAVGYQVLLTGYASWVRGNELATGEIRFLEDLLRSLRSMPRPIEGHSLKGSVDTYSIRNGYYRIDYRVISGKVIVFNVQPVTKLQRLRDAKEKPALYLVERSGGGSWQIASRVEGVVTPYAAVNGQSNNLVKATWLMGGHLDFEFGRRVNRYTLFHNPSVSGLGDTWESVRDKLGITTTVTKDFANILVATENANNETSWLAHSQGGLIFAEGVRYLLNGESSWAINNLSLNGRRHPGKGTLLSKQSVAFHGNANNNFRCRPLFDRAGVRVIATRSHDYDFVANLIGGNTLNVRRVVGSLVYMNHVFSGSVLQSPHTTMQKHDEWERNMSDGPGRGRGRFQKAFRSVELTVEAVKNYLP